MRASLFILALLTSTAATAGEPLWQDIQLGMTSAEVLRLHPEGVQKPDETLIKSFAPMPGCAAKVSISHPRGIVTMVQLRGKGSIGGGCSSQIYEALITKFGVPGETGEAHGLAANGFLGTHSSQLVWRRPDGIGVVFEKKDGQGLLAASWVITYAKLPDVKL